MILQEYLEVKANGTGIQYYKDLGYNVKNNVPFLAKNEDVLVNSLIKENRKCDCCGKIYLRTHKAWNDTFKVYNKDLCVECSKKKRKEKQESTSLEKYGVRYPFQSKEIRDKKDEKFLNKYGVDNPQKILQVKEKTKQTNLKKYGADNPFGSKEIQEKIKQTNLEKYGVTSPLQNSEILQKMVATNQKKYGVDYVAQNAEVKEKMRKTFTKNNTVKTSKPQNKLYELCKELFPNCSVKLNPPLSSMSLDVVLILSNDLKIDIEYDGWFWHHLKARRDRARDEVVKKMGYKIIRIKSEVSIPTKEQLLEAIDYISKEGNVYSCITLKDWIKKEEAYQKFQKQKQN